MRLGNQNIDGALSSAFYFIFTAVAHESLACEKKTQFSHLERWEGNFKQQQGQCELYFSPLQFATIIGYSSSIWILLKLFSGFSSLQVRALVVIGCAHHCWLWCSLQCLIHSRHIPTLLGLSINELYLRLQVLYNYENALTCF